MGVSIPDNVQCYHDIDIILVFNSLARWCQSDLLWLSENCYDKLLNFDIISDCELDSGFPIMLKWQQASTTVILKEEKKKIDRPLSCAMTDCIDCPIS